MPPVEIIITIGSRIPAIVLHKGHIAAQIHGHRSAAYRVFGDQLRWNLHIRLLSYHLPDKFLIVIGFLMAGLGALP